MASLLDLRTVQNLVRLLHGALGVTFVVSEVELTLDQEGDRSSTEALAGRVHVPRVRRRYDREGRWWVWGATRSAASVRVYFKQEDGAEASRLEVIFRRPALRRNGVSAIRDLATAPWAALCGRKLTFVEFRPSRQSRRGMDQGTLSSRISQVGVSRALAELSPGHRRWLRSRLVKSAEHEQFLALVTAFSSGLKDLDLSGRQTGRWPLGDSASHP